MMVQEYSVWSKMLFGTDRTFTTANALVDGLRLLNDKLGGTRLPRLSMPQFDVLINRDAAPLLGL
jgi:uncharacterized protein